MISFSLVCALAIVSTLPSVAVASGPAASLPFSPDLAKRQTSDYCVASEPSSFTGTDGGPCPNLIVTEFGAYPGATWLAHIAAKPDFLLIQPASGNPREIDGNYQTYIRKAQNESVRVLGYIPASGATANMATIKTSIDVYMQQYVVDGIFLADVAASNTDELAAYTELAAYIRTQSQCQHTYVWMSTGPAVVEQFAAIADTLNLFYGEGFPYLSQTFPAWTTAGTYPAKKFSHIVYLAQADTLEAYLDKARASNVGYFYAVDSVWNGEVWAGFASEVSLIEACPAPATSGSTGSVSSGTTGTTSTGTTSTGTTSTGTTGAVAGTTAAGREFSGFCVANPPTSHSAHDGTPCPDLVVTEFGAYPTPGSSTWATHIGAGPAFLIIQPDNGSPRTIDTNYQNAIRMAQAAGVRVLGLVPASGVADNMASIKTVSDGLPVYSAGSLQDHQTP